jgi:hypothetical protein
MPQWRLDTACGHLSDSEHLPLKANAESSVAAA